MKHILPFLLSSLLLTPLPALAQETTGWEPLFLGWESEPAMDLGGRTVVSLQSLISRGIAGIRDMGERHPAVAPAWEFPVGAVLLLVQHEVDGHGGRGREFGLGPSYGFGYDLSAYTTTDRPPGTNEEGSLLAAGGTEATGVMAHRVLLDLLRPDGADGAKVPLAMIAKLDLTLYIASTARPGRPGSGDADDFLEQLEEGNDIAYWLASRQSQRLGGDPADVWFGLYEVDLDDPLLERTWEDARATALWNLLDPSLVTAVVAYFREHVLRGEERVRMPVLRIAEGLGLTLGTRGALGPREVSRFLDLYAATRQGVFTGYVRDLDSTFDRTYGLGAGVHGLRLGGRLDFGVFVDAWEEPDAREGEPRDASGWNATVELNVRPHSRWGFAGKLGVKSEGFLPGLPLADGAYVGLGATFNP